MINGNSSKAKKVLKEFGDHKMNKSHARHISKEKCKEIGLKIIDMENDNELQDLILTAHHAFMHTFSNSLSAKIVENHLGVAYIETMQMAQPVFQMPTR